MGTCDEMMNDEVSVKSYNFKTKERRAAPDNAAALKTRRSPQLAPFSPPNCYLPCIILGQQQQTKCTACQHIKGTRSPPLPPSSSTNLASPPVDKPAPSTMRKPVNSGLMAYQVSMFNWALSIIIIPNYPNCCPARCPALQKVCEEQGLSGCCYLYYIPALHLHL